ncbi:MAG: DUF2155 domain-containing protein [Caulobacterales bacterium]
MATGLSRRGRRLATIAAGALAACAGFAALSQPSAPPASSAPPADSNAAGPPGVPVIQAPPEPPPVEATAPTQPSDNEAATNKAAAAKPEAAAKPVEAPKPVRSPSAILEALDKVTAETLRFEAPVNQPVRYKTLIFTVRACETTGAGDPEPLASAYVVVESQPAALPGRAPPPRKPVYHGWMYANAPSLHPLEHPVYDAWLVACKATPPAA